MAIASALPINILGSRFNLLMRNASILVSALFLAHTTITHDVGVAVFSDDEFVVIERML